MKNKESLGDLLRRFGNWGVYASKTPRVKEVAMYRDPKADGLVQIGMRKEPGITWFGLLLTDDKGKRVHAELTADFGDITSILYEYYQGKCNIIYHGSNGDTVWVRNPKPGHPTIIPTAEQLGWAR